MIFYCLPKWKISSVPAGVPDQLVPIPESFVAVLTGVPLVVALVDAKMFRQVFTFCKSLLADVTAVRTRDVISVSCLVGHQDRLARVEGDGRHESPVVQVRLLNVFLEGICIFYFFKQDLLKTG